MAFIVGGLIIGAGAALGGAALSAKGSRDAAQIAAQGDTENIRYLEESRDIARADLSPYREAGYSALDRLGEMTGLLDTGDSFQPWKKTDASGVYHGSADQYAAWEASPWDLSYQNGQYVARLDDGTTQYWNDASQSWHSSRTSAYGGGGRRGNRTQPRAYGGPLYNVNELGPETVYSGGKATRNSMPTTLPSDPTGYVQPTIGRAIGGRMDDVDVGPYPWGGPQLVENRPVFQDTGTGKGTGDYIGLDRGRKYGDDARPIPGGGAGGTGGTTIDMQADSGGTFVPTTTAYPEPVENPYSIETDPGYKFRFGEGMRALERSASARGGLLSGGFARKAIRYGQDYASAEFSNIYNRISNIAGLSQVGVQGSSNAAIQTGAGMGSAASNRALSSAYGSMGETNAWANAANQVAQLPWGEAFSERKSTRPGRY